ncbi:MAG: hypothetical protein ACE5F6_17620 [Anaerolineae bacterium]
MERKEVVVLMLDDRSVTGFLRETTPYWIVVVSGSRARVRYIPWAAIVWVEELQDEPPI